MKEYQCCATCKNFLIVKNEKAKYICKRLNYETHPKWIFNCWDAREDIKQKMKER